MVYTVFMEKAMTLEQLTDFINALIHSFTIVGVKRIVSPQFRYSDLGAETFILYSAGMASNSHIQLCAKDNDGTISLYAGSLGFTVTETEYDKDSYQYRMDAGDEVYLILRAKREADDRSPLEKFTNP